MVWKWRWWHSWVYANVRIVYICERVWTGVCVLFARVRRRTGERAQSLVKSRVHRRRRDDFSFLGVPFGSFHYIHCSRRRHQQHRLRKLISVHLHLYTLHQLHIRRPILPIYIYILLYSDKYIYIYMCENSKSPRGIGRNRVYRFCNYFALPQ